MLSRKLKLSKNRVALSFTVIVTVNHFVLNFYNAIKADKEIICVVAGNSKSTKRLSYTFLFLSFFPSEFFFNTSRSKERRCKFSETQSRFKNTSRQLGRLDLNIGQLSNEYFCPHINTKAIKGIQHRGWIILQQSMTKRNCITIFCINNSMLNFYYYAYNTKLITKSMSPRKNLG